MKDDQLYLLHIRQCIADIAEYTADGHEVFSGSKLLLDAVVRKLQILAESTIRLPEDLKTAYPQVDWRGIRGFRNFVVHQYFDVDPEEIWNITQRDLPALSAAVKDALDRLNDSSERLNRQ